jgi:hypothetical protein
LAFWGHKEGIDSQKNPGTFLRAFAEKDSVLYPHQPRAKNATYFPPNDTVIVIDYDVICAGIITEVKKAKFFSILSLMKSPAIT